MSQLNIYPDQARIQALRDAAITALEAALANPKPSYWLDNQRVNWDRYREILQQTVNWCINLLKDIDAASQGAGHEETLITS